MNQNTPTPDAHGCCLIDTEGGILAVYLEGRTHSPKALKMSTLPEKVCKSIFQMDLNTPNEIQT